MTNSPKNRQQWILEELKKSPLLSFGECFTKYSLIFTKTKRTFVTDWKKAKSELETYQKKANEAKERVSIELEKEAVKQGLKTKFDRLMILQNQVEDILKRLEKGTHPQETFKEGKVLKFERELTPNEITAYNRTIKELQAEISKIEGDYTAQKMELSGKDLFMDLMVKSSCGDE